MKRVGQIELVAAISKHLEKQGFSRLTTRQFNAIIEALNLICDRFDAPPVPATPGMGIEAWLKCDETGMSSRYMASVLNRAAGRKALDFGDIHQDIGSLFVPCVPHDSSDFARCVAMLDADPELRKHIPVLLEGSGPVWKALAEQWKELEALYREECPSGKAPKLFAALDKIHQRSEAK